MKHQFRRLAALPITLQIGLAVVCALLTLLVANGVAWFSIRMVANTQAQLIDIHIPQQSTALQLIGQVDNLVAIMPALAESDTPQALADRYEEYALLERDLTQTLVQIQQPVHGRSAQAELGDRVAQQVVQLAAQGDKLYQHNAQRIAVRDHLLVVLTRIDTLEAEIMTRLTVELDNQVFFLATGYRELAKESVSPAQRGLISTVADLSKLADMRGALLQVSSTLATMTRVTGVSHLQPLVEKVEAALAHFVIGLNALNSTADREFLTVRADELSKLSIGVRGVVSLVYRQLNQTQEMTETLAYVRNIARSLRRDSEQLVAGVSAQATTSMVQADTAIRRGYLWIVGLAVASAIFAGLYVWGYVRPVLTDRLVQLASRMRSMARNRQLHDPVEVYGRDEIAQMAKDLEVFRQHTLDAQRLDVVEKLAAELEHKNTALEDTLAQLNQAQEQIVLREKLAALGELTAGVAHEIKNPLNFVNNFSATSQELCEELRELLQTPQVEDQEWIAELGEVVDMLSENMQRINGHGHRADRIVNSMLSLGRHAEADVAEVDLAPLVKEHSALAWHSVRATMSGFDVPIDYVFPEAPMIAWVQPQDISRVVLNLVTNACHACLDRQGSPDQAYAPEISVRGSMDDSHVRIDVVDNGVGMSAEVQQQIFNPFFTTKATDQGTGLGLSMAYDIVQQHSGEFVVTSEPGVGTMFSLILPVGKDVAVA